MLLCAITFIYLLQAVSCHADFLDDVFGADVTEKVKTFTRPKTHHNSHFRSRSSFELKFHASGDITHIHAERHRHTEKQPHRYSDELFTADVLDTSKSVIQRRDIKTAMCYPSNISSEKINPLALFLHDKTLKKGDSIVTNTGVQVFRGPHECPHKSDDFVPLKSSAASNMKIKNTLIEIDRATNSPARQFDQRIPSKSKFFDKSALN